MSVAFHETPIGAANHLVLPCMYRLVLVGVVIHVAVVKQLRGTTVSLTDLNALGSGCVLFNHP